MHTFSQKQRSCVVLRCCRLSTPDLHPDHKHLAPSNLHLSCIYQISGVLSEKCETADSARQRTIDKYGKESVAWGNEW